MSLYEVPGLPEPQSEPTENVQPIWDADTPLPNPFVRDGVIIDGGILMRSLFLRRKMLDQTEDFLRYASRMVGGVGIVVTPRSAEFPKKLMANEGARRQVSTIKAAQQMPDTAGALRNLYAAAMEDPSMNISNPKPERTVIVADLSHMKALEGLSDYLIPVVSSGMLGSVATQGYFGYAQHGDLAAIADHLDLFVIRESPDLQPGPRVVE